MELICCTHQMTFAAELDLSGIWDFKTDPGRGRRAQNGWFNKGLADGAPDRGAGRLERGSLRRHL